VIASKRFEPQRRKGHKEIRIALFFVPLAAEASQLETNKSTTGDYSRSERLFVRFPLLSLIQCVAMEAEMLSLAPNLKYTRLNPLEQE